MNVIKFIDGHKTQAGGLLSLTVAFLIQKQLIDDATATYIIGMAGVILGIGIFHSEKKKIVTKKEQMQSASESEVKIDDNIHS